MIDWISLLIVALTALVAASALVALFATGIKLFSVPPEGSETASSARDDETDDVAHSTRPLMATVGGVACFALAALGVLYGVYLVVPALHR
jgi:hypothetical protein